MIASNIFGFEFGNFCKRVLDITFIGERFTIVKIEFVPRVQGHNVGVIGEIFVEQLEKLFKHKWRRDDSWAGIVTESLAFEDLCSSSEFAQSVNQRNVMSKCAAPQGAGDTSESAANNQGMSLISCHGVCSCNAEFW